MPVNPAPKRGDIVLVLFPNSDLRTAKTRPALVIQDDRLNTGIQQVVVAMVSSRMFRSSHPSRVTILLNSPSGKQSGLLTDSVVMTDNIATIMDSAIHAAIGSIPMSDCDKALRHTLGL